MNGGTCSPVNADTEDTEQDLFTCQCAEGYTGNRCESGKYAGELAIY